MIARSPQLLALVLLPFFMVPLGCGNGPEPERMGAVAGIPDGTYVVELDEDEVAQPEAAGRWEMRLEDGRLEVRRDGERVVDATYATSESEIQLVEDRGGRLSCFQENPEWATASYEWSGAADGVIFRPLEDDCPRRRAVLATKAWSRR